MIVAGATRFLVRTIARFAACATALWLIVPGVTPAVALDVAEACKMPVVVAADAGFELKCGKRIPTGIFLGSYLSPATDSVEACAKRCAADNKCAAFSLDNRNPPVSRTCTLFGSTESLSDATDWVAGVRIVDTGVG